MITLHGLSDKQRIFADVLWGLNGEEEVDHFLKVLPPEDRREAQVVIDMMLAALFDECEIEDFSETQELISKVKGH